MSPGTECPVCGEHLPGPDPRRTGRKPGYCSNACKAKAYRARQRSGEHVSAADPALLSSAGDRYVRTTGIHQRISDLTTALADTASGQQALFAPPRTVRRMRPADTAAALHLLIAELAALAAAATSQTHRTHTRPATGAPQTPPLFGEPEAGH